MYGSKHPLGLLKIAIASLLLLCSMTQLPAADAPDLDKAAAEIQRCVVTVRLTNPGEGDDTSKVTVCSGVVVGEKLVVTPIYAGSDTQIRVTFPGGAQATGQVRVLDEYSGLALVQLDQAADTTITLAEELPKVGSWVLSGAGWGVEKPVISLGIVSGRERTLAGLNYPPLLQCDLRTTETSAGAGVVDQTGQLIGIVILADKQQAAGWTYAVPVSHVQRLIRKHEDKKNEGSFVVLKRRRPEVGMVLGGQPDEVRVSRVLPGSPAAKAGLKVGDEVVAVEGLQIRSVYQALRPVLVKQPGDTVTFTIVDGGQRRDVRVVLAGEMELPAAPFANLSNYVQPKIDVEGSAVAGFKARNGRGGVREVAADLDELNAPQPTATDQQKIELLERSLERYQQVIRLLQEQLQEGQKEREQTQQLIESLQRQLDSVKKDG